MRNRHAAASFFVLIFLLAGVLAFPMRAVAGTTDLLAAVKNVSGESDKLRSLMSDITASQIHLVNVQSVMTDAQRSAYQSALHKNASGISDLRDTLNHTTLTGDDGVIITLKKLLLKQNITIEQITGVHVGDDKSITLFYQ